jgi:hypothetical protein
LNHTKGSTTKPAPPALEQEARYQVPSIPMLSFFGQVRVLVKRLERRSMSHKRVFNKKRGAISSCNQPYYCRESLYFLNQGEESNKGIEDFCRAASGCRKAVPLEHNTGI